MTRAEKREITEFSKIQNHYFPELIREIKQVMDGSIPTLKEKYAEMKATHKIKWVNNLEYTGHAVTVMELEIDKNGKKWREFQWITSIKIIGNTAYAFAETGRKRWLIENEGFNIQKNHRCFITHGNSLNHNAMKNH